MIEQGLRPESPEAGTARQDGVTPFRWRYPLLALALALTASGAAGVFWMPEGWTGALFDPDYTIPYIPPEGPLARAGFQAGDSVLTVEGIPVEELGMYSRWPRSLARAPGESLTLVVDRDGIPVTGEIVFGERPPGNFRLQLGGFLVGMAFLWAGIWAVFAAPSPHALRLAAAGLAVAFALPTSSLGSWNGIRDHVQMAAMVLWPLLLLRFFLFFPRRKGGPNGWWTNPKGTALLFVPWVVLLGCLIVELIYHPRFYHSFGMFGGLLMLVYSLAALAVLAHTSVRLSRPERRATGMGRVLGGVSVAVGALLLLLVLTLLPGLTLPGQGWLALSVAAVPLGMALGVRKSMEVTRPAVPPESSTPP